MSVATDPQDLQIDAAGAANLRFVVGTILESRACLVLAKGEAKADVWAKMIEGPVTAQVPASALQLHPWVIAISDEAAAARLSHRDYYQHVDRELADEPTLPPWVFQPELDPRRVAAPGS